MNLCVVIGIVLLGCYMYSLTGYNEFTTEESIENKDPELVWRFLTDFSNIQQLNPTM